jgi:hypothetical protein
VGVAAGGFSAVGYSSEGGLVGSIYDAGTGFWENREGGVSEIGIYADVTYSGDFPPVPLPAGAWLLISGLTGAFMALRRKTRSA